MSLVGLLTAANLLLWMLMTGLVGFVTMGLDKALAKSNWGERMSEKSLGFVALVGGFAGIIVGALTFHHKTSKGEFWPPVVLAVILWVSLLALNTVGYFRA